MYYYCVYNEFLWDIPYFTAHTIVCARVDSQCLEYLGYITLGLTLDLGAIWQVPAYNWKCMAYFWKKVMVFCVRKKILLIKKILWKIQFWIFRINNWDVQWDKQLGFSLKKCIFFKTFVCHIKSCFWFQLVKQKSKPFCYKRIPL